MLNKIVFMSNVSITVASPGARYVKPIAITRQERLSYRLASPIRLMGRKPHGYAGFIEEDNIPANAEEVSTITTNHGSNASNLPALVTT